MIDSPNDDLLKKLNDDSLINMNRRIKNIAKNKYDAFVKSLEFVGTRIPCQSMQSFAPMRVIAFADTDINECYIPSHISWVEGSDYDIDKQYIIGYSLLKDGTMPSSFKSTSS